ncbi:hypothetical protein LTR84_009514 [Exophiala bonariae]|uniref:6-phosphogluconate dehydrogenase NADP-binding domain-containing protein n=1 Tax=Exophiala bonariae TaxID=1690606 RepID=A0AAV9MX45_9EURO|nr:hypothetical protein LTR84_009514 [Exophiala bonariae]
MAASNSGVTLVGLGNMGTAIAHAFLKSGRSLTIWNRTSTRPSVTELVVAGASYEPDLAEAISANNIIVFCVLEYQNIYQGLQPLVASGVLKDKVMVNLTNGTPQDAREASVWLKERGVANYFDGGIMVTPQNVGTPVSIVLISGEDEDMLESSGVRGLISSIGLPDYKGEDAGIAAGYDIALLSGMFGMFIGSLTALAMIRKQIDRARKTSGADGTKKAVADVNLTNVVTTYFNPLLTSLIPHNELLAAAIDNNDQDNNHGNPMEMMRIAINNIIRGCEEEGVDAENLRHFAKLTEQVVHLHGPDSGLAWVHSLLLK